MSREDTLFQTSKNLFIGAPVEGQSGYINLMRIRGSLLHAGDDASWGGRGVCPEPLAIVVVDREGD